MPTLETVVAWDHHYAGRTSIDEMLAKRAVVVTHGVVVAEDDVFLFVAQGSTTYAGEPVYLGDLDITAVLKSAVIARRQHGDVPETVASPEQIAELRKAMGL